MGAWRGLFPGDLDRHRHLSRTEKPGIVFYKIYIMLKSINLDIFEPPSIHP